MKKILSVLLVMAMLLSLAACGGSGDGDSTASGTASSGSADATQSQTTDDSNYNKILTVGISADPTTWEPWAAFSNGRRDTMPMVYQTLTAVIVDLDTNTMNTYWVLASGAEQIDDNTYEITIREGIYDTAGNDFNANDVAFSYTTAKELGTLSQLNAIKEVVALDEYTVQMTTNNTLSVGDFEDLLTGFNMVTQASYEASPDGMVSQPVGTTGYVMESYTAGSGVVFTKADTEYWNQAANDSKSVDDGYCYIWETGNVDTVNFDIISDTSTMAIALETGAIDITSRVSINDIDLFEKSDDFSVYSYPENMYGISFNVSDSAVTSNYNLRMAIALAVDSQQVLDATFNGDGLVLKAWSYPTYADYQSVWDKEDYFEYDLTKAKEYLEKFYAETGESASTLKLRLLTQTDATMQKATLAIQNLIIALVGNESCCTIEQYDMATYTQTWKDETAFEICVLNSQSFVRSYTTYAWNNFANALKAVHKQNIFFDDNEELQELLNVALNPKTHSDASVQAYQEYINENVLMKNLCSGTLYGVAADWIDGLEYVVGPKAAIAVCALDYDWAAANK